MIQELKEVETERLKALKRYEVLDTPPDGSFDRITALASKMFNMPIALISLVDEDRIWFKSHYGLEINQINRDEGLCSSAIMSNEGYLVEDAIEDPRTLANPLVAGEFGLRFYAAAPLITKDNHKLGTFCVIDKSQRFLNKQQMDMLKDLAQIVMDEMELRLASRNAIKKSNERINALELENQSLKQKLINNRKN